MFRGVATSRAVRMCVAEKNSKVNKKTNRKQQMTKIGRKR